MFKLLLSPRWRKVLRDLWLTKTRTLLVVLSIAVGVFAVGTIASAQIILSRDLRAMYLATNPAQATILTIDSFDDDLVKAVDGMRRWPKPRRGAGSRLVKTGRMNGLPLWLIAVPDFDEIKIDQFWPERGALAPAEHELLIERAALVWSRPRCDTILVKTPEARTADAYCRPGLMTSTLRSMSLGGGLRFCTFDTLEC